ncbi:hypothetical protein GCM10009840_18000 [Pseudolysinimonas kribbensis]|nr:hypothetical protein [Pseudolysinimonas kribbensis]
MSAADERSERELRAKAVEIHKLETAFGDEDAARAAYEAEMERRHGPRTGAE